MSTSGDSSLRVVITALLGNTAVTVSKFVGWAFTGSASMLAEAIHSAADTANQVFLFIGIKKSFGSPNKIFPWGTGQARYVWNLISAMGIFFIGFGVTVYHGIHALVYPKEFDAAVSLSFNFSILLFAFLVEGYAFLIAVKEVNKQRKGVRLLRFLRQSDDPTTLGVLFEDFIAAFGIFVAVICIGLSHYFQTNTPDAIGSIIIGFLLGLMALYLSKINGTLLIGTSVSSEKEEQIKKYLESIPEIEKIVKMKTVVLGSGQLHLSIEVELHGEMLVDKNQIGEDAEKIRLGKDPVPILVDTAGRMVRVVGEKINELERKIKREFPELVTIEFELN